MLLSAERRKETQRWIDTHLRNSFLRDNTAFMKQAFSPEGCPDGWPVGTEGLDEGWPVGIVGLDVGSDDGCATRNIKGMIT